MDWIVLPDTVCRDRYGVRRWPLTTAAGTVPWRDQNQKTNESFNQETNYNAA
ncbi:MAG: hypothetical protein RIR25_1779 [Verrucomicrobiota bacterium]|jgi:hypothetical protein